MIWCNRAGFSTRGSQPKLGCQNVSEYCVGGLGGEGGKGGWALPPGCARTSGVGSEPALDSAHSSGSCGSGPMGLVGLSILLQVLEPVHGVTSPLRFAPAAPLS